MSIVEPGKITVPFADSGLKNTIPQAANNTTGKAGFDKGFPERTMLPKASGGIPPSGMDFNGILFDVTNILRYMQAGGRPTFSAEMATAIGGYPVGAVLVSNDGKSVFQNTLDGNANDPNLVATGWARPDLQVMELYRRSYAEAGDNVAGTFQAGFTYVNANDVGIDLATGKGYTGPAGVVAAGTNPASGGFVDVSGVISNQTTVFASTFGSGIESLGAAIGFAKANGISRVVCDHKQISVTNPNRSSTGYSSYMTWNYCALIDGFDGEIDLSACEFSVAPWTTSAARITVFVLTNCSGVFKLPRVKGNLRQHNMGTTYIDDSFVRVGGGCKNLKVHNGRLIEDYPGFGVMVRHYQQDNPTATFADTVPDNIDVVGRGGVVGCWSGGVVTVTGYNVTVTVNSEWNGTVPPLNGNFVSNIGHGVHFEAVTDGSQNPYVNNQRAVMCNTGYNKLNGLMFHTAIKNYSALNNHSYGNGQYGAEYNAYTDGLISFGNTFEGNADGGLLLSLSTASWAGLAGKSVGAEIRDDIKFNQGFGINDLSHAKGVTIGGRVRRNKGSGYFAADGSSTNRNTLSGLILEDNGDGAASDVYAMTLTSEIIAGVTIINSNPATYKQIPIRLKASRPLVTGEVVVIGDSPNGVDVVIDGGQPARVPAGLSKSPLTFSNGSFISDRLFRGTFGTGQWLIPMGFDMIDLTAVSGQFPSYMLTEEATAKNTGYPTKIRVNAKDATLTLRSGTVNGSSSMSLTAGVIYTVTYTGVNQATVA